MGSPRRATRGHLTLYDTTLSWRFVNPRLADMHPPYSMGETAENVATKYGVSRHDQDVFALRSQQRAAAAIAAGRFTEEIVGVPVPQKKGEPVIVSHDEHPRPETSLEALSKLKPAFRQSALDKLRI